MIVLAISFVFLGALAIFIAGLVHDFDEPQPSVLCLVFGIAFIGSGSFGIWCESSQAANPEAHLQRLKAQAWEQYMEVGR